MIRKLYSRTRDGIRPVLGPQDSGRLIALEEYQYAKETAGYVYEVIDGVLIVSPQPRPSHDRWVRLIRDALVRYAVGHPSVISEVSDQAEVVIPGRPGLTRVAPDIATYMDLPDLPPSLDDWAEVCPLVVVEVISERREKKDTTRNRHVYWTARGIMEYWIIDPREDKLKPELVALVRRAGALKWEEHVVPFGKSFKSVALPRFTLNLKRIKLTPESRP